MAPSHSHHHQNHTLTHALLEVRRKASGGHRSIALRARTIHGDFRAIRPEHIDVGPAVADQRILPRILRLTLERLQNARPMRIVHLECYAQHHLVQQRFVQVVGGRVDVARIAHILAKVVHQLANASVLDVRL